MLEPWETLPHMIIFYDSVCVSFWRKKIIYVSHFDECMSNTLINFEYIGTGKNKTVITDLQQALINEKWY